MCCGSDNGGFVKFGKCHVKKPKKKEQNTMNSHLSPPLSTPFLVDSGLKKTAKAMSKESKDTHIYVYMYARKMNTCNIIK